MLVDLEPDEFGRFSEWFHATQSCFPIRISDSPTVNLELLPFNVKLSIGNVVHELHVQSSL